MKYVLLSHYCVSNAVAIFIYLFCFIQQAFYEATRSHTNSKLSKTNLLVILTLVHKDY